MFSNKNDNDVTETRNALNSDINSNPSKKLAVISGAGIAGLAASFELIKKGYIVVITEKRETFNRFNIINIDVESQRFLNKHGLLAEFKKSVASRIEKHKYVHITKTNEIQTLFTSDVRYLEVSTEPFEPSYFNNLFNEDGFFSVKIKDLQEFLANEAVKTGAYLFKNIETEIFTCTQAMGVFEVKLGENFILKPDLFFVAEGAHSTTAQQLGIDLVEVKNECSDEHWIFGNVSYPHPDLKTRVLCIIDVSEGVLDIANIIFNSQKQEINIAVTSTPDLDAELTQKRLLVVLRKAFDILKMNDLPQSFTMAVNHPVHVNNKKRQLYSRDNVFFIGDTAGYSSPLAGMGGTLGLTLIPHLIEQLINNCDQDAQKVHEQFDDYSEASVSRWINKAQKAKKYCMSFFENNTEPADAQLNNTLCKGVI